MNNPEGAVEIGEHRMRFVPLALVADFDGRLLKRADGAEQWTAAVTMASGKERRFETDAFVWCYGTRPGDVPDFSIEGGVMVFGPSWREV